MAKKQGTLSTPYGAIDVGDIGYAHTTGLLGFLIRLGETIKFRSGRFNHQFTVVSTGELSNEIWIVEATLKGVKLSLLSDLLDKGADITILPPPAVCERHKIAEFNFEQVGSKYGLLSDICIAVDILTWEWVPAFRRPFTWICSALAQEGLRYGGWLISLGDIYTPTPEQNFIRHSAQLIHEKSLAS